MEIINKPKLFADIIKDYYKYFGCKGRKWIYIYEDIDNRVGFCYEGKVIYWMGRNELPIDLEYLFGDKGMNGVHFIDDLYEQYDMVKDTTIVKDGKQYTKFRSGAGPNFHLWIDDSLLKYMNKMTKEDEEYFGYLGKGPKYPLTLDHEAKAVITILPTVMKEATEC